MKVQDNTTKKIPTCLDELDFEILCKLGGKEQAIKIFYIVHGLRRERAASSSKRIEN